MLFYDVLNMYVLYVLDVTMSITLSLLKSSYHATISEALPLQNIKRPKQQTSRCMRHFLWVKWSLLKELGGNITAGFRVYKLTFQTVLTVHLYKATTIVLQISSESYSQALTITNSNSSVNPVLYETLMFQSPPY